MSGFDLILDAEPVGAGGQQDADACHHQRHEEAAGFLEKDAGDERPDPRADKEAEIQMLPMEPTRDGGDTASTVVQALLDDTEWKNWDRLKKTTDRARLETSRAGMMHTA